DFLWEIANKLPATLYCLIIGAPLTDAGLIQHLSEECMLLSAPPLPGHRERLEVAASRTKDYLLELTQQRRENPGEDLLSFLVTAESRGEIDETDILAVAFNALVGSTDTTAAQMCCNLEALAHNRDQWQLLRCEPERVPHAVMELMRYNPGAWSITRSAKESLTYRGAQLTPDVTVFPLIFAANNDPTVFPDPRVLDVTRTHAKQPLNFGAGVHGCLGRMFSLLEQEEVLRATLERWESVEVVEAKFSGAMFFLVPEAFRVSFVPAAR
ncbi:MAG TPA: cytochrome P450, partial [Pseudonocardiaceae bacterium]|nr:cytochrome P450 [Pseudonocardiaceae bacterium]